MADLTAVRIDPDGTRTDTPLGGDMHAVCRSQLGWPVFAHYGRPGGEALAVIVCDESGDLPYNPIATAMAEHARGGPLSYGLYGPALLLGYQPHRDTHTNLTEAQQTTLAQLIGTAR